jgi:non-specific protein-tyrosine kinase
MIDHQNNNSNSFDYADSSDSIFYPALADDIRRYMGMLWHWAWLIAIFAVLGGLIGYFTSNREIPLYRSAATIWISESRTLNEYANILASERLAQTYAQLMLQKPVFEGVIQELGLDISATALKNNVSVAVVEDTQLLLIQVVDTDPVRGAQIANTIGVVFSRINQEFQTSRYSDSKATLSEQLAQADQQIQDAKKKRADLEASLGRTINEDGSISFVVSLEQQRELDRIDSNLTLFQQIYTNLLQSLEAVRLAEAQGVSTVTLVEQADPAPRPFRPNVVQDTMLAVIVGLLVGVGLAFLIEALDDTVKGPADITRSFGLSVLGYVGNIPDDSNLITSIEPRSPISEAFRALRTNIQYASVDHPIHRLLITSPTPQDGKSTVVANLGVVISQSGRKVTLVDADMRRPSLHRKLKMANRLGLSDLFVQEKIHLDGSSRDTRVPGMSVITSGGLPPNPSELIGSEKMIQVLEEIRTEADFVIVDTPPVMAVTDAAALAPRMDGVIIVVRPGATKLAQTRHTIETLQRGGANILGVVLNDIDHKRSRYMYYYQGYYTYDSYYGEGLENQNGNGRRKRKKTKESKILENEM